MNKTTLSWGRYPATQQDLHPCVWRSDLSNKISDLQHEYGTTLPFGNGRSYGDSCYADSGHALHTKTLNRFIMVDWTLGVLRAEAGVTLSEILELSIPRGWFLPVTPGTQFVTLGGAIANDVHGKNHHVRGTFGNHVRCFSLRRSNEPAMLCSLEDNSSYFAATIGGLGLTGVIEWAEIALMPIQSSQIDTTSIRFDRLTDFFTLAKDLDSRHEYGVAWIDCLATGSRAGRGIFIAANHAQEGALKTNLKNHLSIPVIPRFSIINGLTTRLFNTLNWHLQSAQTKNKSINFEPYFYPLDRVLQWNRLYGRKGFQQFQCVIPEHAAEPALAEILVTIAKSKQASFLAVLKRCGDMTSPGLLSFPMSGTSLAIDFPNSQNLTQTLLPKLDAIVRASRGRLYPAKDAHMTGEDFRNAYPAWTEVEKLRDPALNSQFWKRVTT